ncbi:MAG TPA: hypothetical protein VF933_29470 [Streptosporangiaceae bacterium]
MVISDTISRDVARDDAGLNDAKRRWSCYWRPGGPLLMAENPST